MPNEKIICIDAGHGGSDPGAIHNNIGITEKKLTLNIATTLGYALVHRGYKVYMTRDSDTFVPLGARCKISNGHKSDLFVSVHINAAENRTARGIETWHLVGSEKGKTLAECIQRKVKYAYDTVDRGIKASKGFYVLKHTIAPAVICELGFISSDSDIVKLCEPTIRDRLAVLIADGIDDYFNAESDAESDQDNKKGK